MKVLCIAGIKRGEVGRLLNCVALKEDEIYEGEVYTVLSTTIRFGIEVFTLEEKPKRTYYNSNRFIPLSDIDEKEFQREIFQPVDQRDLIWH